MSESVGNASAARAGNGRSGAAGSPPSLFSGREANADRQPERISILSSLDRGGVATKAGWVPGRRAGLVLLGVLAAGAVIVAVRSLYVADTPAGVGSAPQAAVVPPVTSAPAVVETPQSQAALIENVPPPNESVPLASLADASSVAVAAGEGSGTNGVSAGSVSADTGERVPVAALAAEAPVTPAVPEVTDSGKERGAVSRPGTEKRVRKAHSSDKGKPNPASDNDAALLAALVAHEAGTPIEVRPVKAISTKGSGASSGKHGSSQARKRKADFDPKRDVVEDDEKVSTAELVRRCGTLGLIEGFLCKTRVCSNRQDGDPACPRPVEPTARGG